MKVKKGLLLLILLVIPLVAFGQSGGHFYAHSIQHLKNVLAPMWKARTLQIADAIFITLVIIDLIFIGYSMTIGNLKESALQVIVNRIIIYGILFAFLFFFQYLSYIVWGFEHIAGLITGVNTQVSPYDLLAKGWHFLVNVSSQSLKKFTVWAIITGDAGTFFGVFMYMFAAFAVMIGLFIVALEYAFLQIEIILMLTVGPIFLGFSPLKSTRQWATGYLTYMIGLGIRLFIFFIILGFSYGVMQSVLTMIQSQAFLSFMMIYSLAFFAILTVFLLAKLPHKIERKITAKANFNVEGLLPKQS